MSLKLVLINPDAKGRRVVVNEGENGVDRRWWAVLDQLVPALHESAAALL
jgi:hypothetical protein